MTTTASEAARQLSQARWGNRRPTRLARELVQRVAELPAAERQALRQALEDARGSHDELHEEAADLAGGPA